MKPPSLASSYCFGCDMAEGKWRILQSAKGHRLLALVNGPTYTGYRIPTKKELILGKQLQIPPRRSRSHAGQSAGNFREVRSQRVAAGRCDHTYLKEMQTQNLLGKVLLQRSQLMTKAPGMTRNESSKSPTLPSSGSSQF